jgi:hypothetical protein
MTTEEALNLIAETNEPLSVVLREILTKVDRLDDSQTRILEGIIAHILTPQGQPSTFDLSAIIELLSKKN